MISGSTTILKAEMSLEKNIEKMNNQYLVVVDSKGRIDNWEIIKRQAWWNSTPIVLCSKTTPNTYIERLKAQNIHFLIHGTDNVDIKTALQDLYSRFHIKTLRIDSGGILAGVLLRDKLVDEISVLFSPQLTGGTTPNTIFVTTDIKSLEEIIDLELVSSEIVEENYIWVKYKVKK